MKITDFYIGEPCKGEVGIEVEVEGKNLPRIIPQGWSQVVEHSLRGENAEYILKKPVSRKRISRYLGVLAMAYRKAKTEVRFSDRQSVHVHINVQTMDVVSVYNFIILFIIFEKYLVKFCGEGREGNLFCLRATDAGGLISYLEKASSPDKFYVLDTGDIRYSAINVSSIFKFGSLEFRSMRGTDDFKLIENWVNILLNLKDAASEFKNPIEIVTALSREGTDNFTKNILGDNASLVLDEPNYERTIYNSMRRLQMLAFSGDWKGFATVKEEEEDDEQERGTARMVQQMQAARIRRELDADLVDVRAPAVPPRPMGLGELDGDEFFFG